MNNVSQAHVDVLLADFMQDKKKMLDLLHKNGIKVGNTLSLKVVQTAFLKAIKDSDHFRQQVTAALTQHSNFVDNMQYLNETGTDAEPWLGGTPTTTSTTTTSTTKTKSFFGSIFTPELIQSGIKTGLEKISADSTAKARQQSEQNALELERIRLEQINAQANANKNKPAGMSTGLKVGLIVGGIAVVGTVIWLVVRARKKRA